LGKFFSSKTSLDRLKLISKTKKKKLCPVSNHCGMSGLNH
jgi:hypothetical protein